MKANLIAPRDRLLITSMALVIAASWVMGASGPAFATNYLGVHWAKGAGSTYARSYAVDSTSAAWPVSSKTALWDQVTRFDAYYGGCTGNFCFVVDEAFYGNNGILGETKGSVDSNGHWVKDTVVIHFNNSEADTSTERAVAACHELGHVMGLQHAADSCLTSPYSPTYQSPSAHDLNYLSNDIYNHSS